MLDEHSPVPLYYQLKELIEKQIDSGFFKPGEKIPSENKLCQQYSISRTTVRLAIADLVNNNKLIRTQGLGTFVSKSRVTWPTYKSIGFSQDMESKGHSHRSKVLDLSPCLPPTDVAQSLQIKENEAVIYIKRLRYVDDQVIGLDINYLPFDLFSGLLDEDLENNSLYQILTIKYNTIPTRSFYQVKSIKCPREIATLLQTSSSEPILHLTGEIYDQNNIIFQYGVAYDRGDRFAFDVEIRTPEGDNFNGIYIESK